MYVCYPRPTFLQAFSNLLPVTSSVPSSFDIPFAIIIWRYAPTTRSLVSPEPLPHCPIDRSLDDTPVLALICSVETNWPDCEDYIIRARSYHSNFRRGAALGPESVTFPEGSRIGATEVRDGWTNGRLWRTERG